MCKLWFMREELKLRLEAYVQGIHSPGQAAASKALDSLRVLKLSQMHLESLGIKL